MGLIWMCGPNISNALQAVDYYTSYQANVAFKSLL